MEHNDKNINKRKNKIMTKESVFMTYEANNVKFERCELYNDFVQSLLRLVFDTYMGDDVTDTNNKLKHFKWCWDKNLNNFKEEGVFFFGDKLYEYFLAYMNEVFYSPKKDSDYDNEKEHLDMWHNLFNYTKQKTSYELDTFIEIYKIFEKSQNLTN
jgi:hypothetical protein